jgi:hypothetical protein
MPNFEVYERQNSYGAGRRRGGNTVTVHRAGVVSFSAVAMAVLGNPRAVVYLIDKDDRLLGFRAVEPGTPNASMVGGSGHTASAASVLKYMKADLSQSRRYPLVEIDGVQVIDLKEPGTPVTINRRKGD